MSIVHPARGFRHASYVQVGLGGASRRRRGCAEAGSRCRDPVQPGRANPLQSRCLALPRTARPLQSTSLDIDRDQTTVARKHPPHPEEVALLEALRAGDQRARTTLVRRYHSALVHQAFRVLRDKGLAEDAVQDAWIAAFHSISGSTVASASSAGWRVS